jgi:signal transduction histidine kinase
MLEMRDSLAQVHAHLESIVLRNIGVMLQLSLLCTVVIAGAGYLFVARPMRELLDKVRRIGRGDLSRPLVLRHDAELGELAREINAMCEQLDTAQQRAVSESEARLLAVEQMRHADRLSTVGRLASGIAHELGTPMNVILAHAHMMARKETIGDAVVKDAEVIAAQTERMAKIIRQLLDLARRETPRKQTENMADLLTRTVELLEPVASRARVELVVREPADSVIAQVDAAQLQQVIVNLVMNGIQAQPAGGKVTLSVQQDERAVKICVEDQGTGISADARARVFEPFYTTKPSGEGTGLGLSVSEGIVRDHGGHIEVAQAQPHGTVFRVHLPKPAIAA